MDFVFRQDTMTCLLVLLSLGWHPDPQCLIALVILGNEAVTIHHVKVDIIGASGRKSKGSQEPTKRQKDFKVGELQYYYATQLDDSDLY